MKAMLIEDEVDLIIVAIEYASEDILERYGAKRETFYEIIEKELKDIQQAIHSRHAVPTVPSSSNIAELGDEAAQLQRLEDVREARLRRVHEEKEKATKSLKQEKEEVMEQLRVAQSCVTAYEKDKYEIRVIFR
jgi:hypothetical protein